MEKEIESEGRRGVCRRHTRRSHTARAAAGHETCGDDPCFLMRAARPTCRAAGFDPRGRAQRAAARRTSPVVTWVARKMSPKDPEPSFLLPWRRLSRVALRALTGGDGQGGNIQEEQASQCTSM